MDRKRFERNTPMIRTALALILAAALAAAAVAVMAPPAAAASYPGEAPNVNRHVAELVTVGLGYWHRSGVTGCPAGVEVLEADSLLDTDGIDGVVGRGDLGACRIWLDRAAVRFMDAEGGYVSLCDVVVHEVGHALGLEHTATGVMAAGMPEDQDAGPWACRKWARGAERRRVLARTARIHRNHRGNRSWATANLNRRHAR